MKTFFVIREFASGKYLSIYDVFEDNCTMIRGFDSEESALKELEKLHGKLEKLHGSTFIIEKVYNL